MINTHILEGWGSGSGIINATREEARQWQRLDGYRHDESGTIASTIDKAVGCYAQPIRVDRQWGLAGRACSSYLRWAGASDDVLQTHDIISASSAQEAALAARCHIWARLGRGLRLLRAMHPGNKTPDGDVYRRLWAATMPRRDGGRGRTVALAGYRAALRSLRGNDRQGIRGRTTDYVRLSTIDLPADDDTTPDARARAARLEREIGDAVTARSASTLPDPRGADVAKLTRWVWEVLYLDQVKPLVDPQGDESPRATAVLRDGAPVDRVNARLAVAAARARRLVSGGQTRQRPARPVRQWVKGKGSAAKIKAARARALFLVRLMRGASSDESARRAGYASARVAFESLKAGSAPLVAALVGAGLSAAQADKLFTGWRSGRCR